ncbi:Zn-dependent alcohol dehydrogenase [Saccharobesus litoralis]|uniref:Zn-dependent alcohol dehydrogenase n=1 Tax=Saccharobesus litoralis TaxID=2172099 RepID=A0A2S0VMY0_9ALTE|nr:alcohol dehydrogenase catalytic domain-containing protein [Saccharobesus litoralis]AWB65581.1 Zn-dependent alcohol dehydrogenase [Saccharobesus litoralis]
MKSLNLIEPGKFSFQEVAMPQALAGETLVKVLSCGVCGSDIHAMSGKQPFFSYPRRLGHELCVEVVSPAEGSELTAGDRCVVEPYYFCGECFACRTGKTNCCSNLQVLGIHFDGGHTPFMTVPTQYLHKANQLTPEQAALVEPLAIGAHAVSRAEISEGDPVVILGMGTIGLAAALFAKAAGANLLVVDVDDNRLQFAEHTLQLGKAYKVGATLQDDIYQHFGQLPERIIDATGNEHSMNACFDLVEVGGHVVFVGLHLGQVKIDVENFVNKGITLAASRAAISDDFKQVIDAISSGAIDPTPMISQTLQFDQLDTQLLELIGQPGLIKALIEY